MACNEFSWTTHDHRLPIGRIPDVIAATVQPVVDDLKAASLENGPRPAGRVSVKK
jgi:hypothetical protein